MGSGRMTALPVDRLRDIEQQIAWVVAHPGTSDWLRSALLAAADRDPVHLLNDLEILCLLLRSKAQSKIHQQLRQARG